MDALQVRMALSGLRITNRQLAKAAKIGLATLWKLDTGSVLKERTLDDIQRTLEAAGARFVEDGEWVGIMVRKAGVAPDAAKQATAHRGARAKAEAVVDRALGGVDAPAEQKARAKRRLTRVSKGLKK